MKKLLKLLTLIAFGAAVAWLLRDQLVPGPTAPTAHPPPFRHPPEAPQRAPAPAPSVADDLTEVNGIGPVYAGKLTAAGITTFQDLASADADRLSADAGLPRDRVADWIGKAADLA
jgi:predicted flap endonuclease-1-like 5' DNA nuclease